MKKLKNEGLMSGTVILKSSNPINPSSDSLTLAKFATTIILALFLPFLWNGSGVGANTSSASVSNTIDSLRQVIKTAKHDTTRINAYLVWGEQIYMQLPDSAIALWKISETIANKNLSVIARNEAIPPNKTTKALKDTLLKQKASALNNIGFIYNNQGDIPKALEYYNKSLNIFEEIGDKKGMAYSFINIGYIYNHQGDIPKALEYYNKSLNIQEEILERSGNPDSKAYREVQKGMAYSFNNIGMIYNNQGDIPKALEYFNKSLNIREEIGDKQGMATSFNNIGLIYDNQGDIPKALEYYNKSLNIHEEIGDKKGMAGSFNNIGYIYNNQGDIPKALEYYNKSLNIEEEIGNKQGMANSFNNIGVIYDNQGDIPKALEYFNKSLNIQEVIGDKKGMATSFNNIGGIYFKNNNYALAKSYIEKGYKLSKELGFPENIESAAMGLKKIYEKQGNYKLAFEFYQEEILMHDSIQNEENYKKTQKQQAKYEYEKKAATDSITHTKAMEIKDLDLKRQKAEGQKQRILLFSFLAGFIIILVFSVFLYRLFVQKKMANAVLAQQKEEISAQRDEIETQRDLVTQQKEHIEEIHKEVTDSINYAKRIQEAMLPVLAPATLTKFKTLSKFNLETFILFRPKDVVSGDFYWFSQVNEYQIYAVADCTGHGVPGAFMSMLGISFLNEIVRKKEVTQASHVLDQLRVSIIDALRQTGGSGTQKDGMDMSLVVISQPSKSSELLESSELYHAQWAGANNPLWLVRANKNLTGFENLLGLEEVKPDKMPIAIYERMESFTNHELQLNSGDTIYLMSDGYEDQFGGEKFKKFMSKRLKELLVTISEKTMNEQQKILDLTFENWKGEHEQIDDVTLLGIRI